MADRRLRIASGLSLPPTDLDLSWAAGLFEGEGTVTIAVRRLDSTYRVLCTVGMTDEECVRTFHEWWPGWLQHKPEKAPRRAVWTWTVAGPRAEAFLRDIEPFIHTARVQEKLTIALQFRRYQSRLKSEQTRPEYRQLQQGLYERMRGLNARGVAVVGPDR